MKIKNCIFCNPRKEDILGESKHFFVYLGIGLACEGHVMIIPKDHLRCILETKHDEEFISLKKKVVSFVSEYFYEPFVAEYGPKIQTINHAHTHIIPKKGEKYKIESVIPIIHRGDTKIEEVDWVRAKNIYKERERGCKDKRGCLNTCILVEDKGRLFYCHEKGPGAPLHLGYRFFLSELDDTIPISWKDHRDITKDNKRRDKTREIFRRYFS